MSDSIKSERIVGIIGAMPEEVNSILELMEVESSELIAGKEYHRGKINTLSVVVVITGWGKVASASTVTVLLQHFKVTEIIFSGVAGGIHPNVKIGDVIIGTRLLQHDLDARPMIQRYEIPILKKIYCEANPVLLEKAFLATTQATQSIRNTFESDFAYFNIDQPQVLKGEIASGDQFFSTSEAKEQLRRDLPNVLCVEMEGAAVAQVCDEFNIPFVVIRTISDTSDEESEINFPKFIEKIASVYSKYIIDAILKM